MLKPTPSKPGLFSVARKQFGRLRGIAVSISIALVFTVLYFASVTPPVASAATNNTLNFQARLETAAGGIVPDGNYDVEFKLYSASSGGSAEWTEDYTYNSGAGSTDARIHVANGYLTVNLGSITSFPTTINWDQQQWLTMNIGGTVSSGTITWDGEMSPRLALTAVPYAFRAGTLVTGNGTNSSTLTLIQPASSTQVFQVPDQGAAGTYNLLTGGNVSGAIAGVVLQSGTPGTVQTGNFNVSGTGVVGTTLQTPILDTPSGTTTLNIGKASGGNATLVQVNQNTLINTAASAIAFQVENSGSSQIMFTVDTSGNHVLVGSPANCSSIPNYGRFCVGYSTSGAGSGGTLTNAMNYTSLSFTSGSADTIVGQKVRIDDTSSTSIANTIQGFDVDTSNSTNTSATITSIQATAPAANAGNLLDLQSCSAGSCGTIADVVKVSNTGVVTFKNQANSTSAFSVQGTGGTHVLNVDTTNNYVGIDTTSPGRPLDVAINNAQVAAPMELLEQAGTGDSSLEFKDPNNSMYVGQDADGSDSFIISSSTAASHNRAGAPYDLGYNSIADSFNDSGNQTLIASMPFTTSLGGTTNQVTVDFSAGAGDNFEVAIYADSGSNYPGTLLASSPSTAISAAVTGGNNWNTATLSSTVTLNPSTKYWLAYETQNGIANYWQDTTKGATCWQTISGSFGSWTPVNTTSCDQGYVVNNTYGIYALVNPVGSAHSISDTFSNPLMTMTQSGFTTFEGMSNSTTAFQVVNSSASAVLDVDTTNSQVGIGTAAPSTALQVAVNNTTTNNLPLSLQQTGTGNTGVQFTTTNGSIYEGADTDGTFRISSSTAASSNSSILGNNAIGPFNDNGDLGAMFSSQFVASSTGTITTLNTYVYTVGTGATNHGEMALYSDSGGSPHTLLANSASTVLTANSWNSFSIPSTAVTAGTNYWLMFEADSNTTGYANATANVQYPTVDETHTYSAALPTTWATTTSFYGNEASMYASILNTSSGTDSLSSGGNNVATLGKTSGTSTDTGDGSNINCSQFTPSVGGTTNYMTVAMGTTSSSGISYSFGIYTGTAAAPQTKVATSSTGTLNTVKGLQSLPISATLTAGTLYWLCANSSAASGSFSNYTYNPTDGVATWFVARTFGSGWPASMPSGTATSGSLDISVNYTITPNTAGLLRMTNTGQTTLQNVSNTTNAFQIQDSGGGTAFNVDTTDDFVGIGTATPHAQLEVTGDVYLGTQALTANDQADVCLFGNNTCTAAQSGAFNNQLKIFGGGGAADNLFLYQAAGGNAYIGSSTDNLVLETTSNNANILIEPNGTGQVISSTILAFDPNSAGNAESWHTLTLTNGWGGTFRYRMLPDGTVEVQGAITSNSATSFTVGTMTSGYVPANTEYIAAGANANVASGIAPFLQVIASTGVVTMNGLHAFSTTGTFVVGGTYPLN